MFRMYTFRVNACPEIKQARWLANETALALQGKAAADTAALEERLRRELSLEKAQQVAEVEARLKAEFSAKSAELADALAREVAVAEERLIKKLEQEKQQQLEEAEAKLRAEMEARLEEIEKTRVIADAAWSQQGCDTDHTAEAPLSAKNGNPTRTEACQGVKDKICDTTPHATDDFIWEVVDVAVDDGC